MVMFNTLTLSTGVTVGPSALETLIKHYYQRISKAGSNGSNDVVPAGILRQRDLQYDTVFMMYKNLLEATTRHTVEEQQDFANVRLPPRPSAYVIRLLVPMASCDDAAVHLIIALGGEEAANRVVGGTKWWQVRSVKGVNAQWIANNSDIQEAKQSLKLSRKQGGPDRPQGSLVADDARRKEAINDQMAMDSLPCILFFHGGGYCFGSTDTERSFIQRYARKIKGRALAVDYRLAPQYPFPCAIQDALAAYLYLIRPPPGSPHAPVDPGRIVVSGDSAGGGLTLALLQVIRDSNLPMPAGAAPISPWCDLTHSFPSIDENKDTDVIPPCGLSLHKPSVLWPPPQGDNGHAMTSPHQDVGQTAGTSPSGPSHAQAASGDAPLPTFYNQDILVNMRSGESMVLKEQLQIYTTNNLITHPLVSPAFSYLGGLPPLLVFAGDREVIRDEIVYTAHKAARPHAYPVYSQVKALYPALEGIETRYGPTQVHLQVFDDCPHTLAVLFPFTKPSKYYFRAIAMFTKHVMGLLPSETQAHPVLDPGLPSLGFDASAGQEPQPHGLSPIDVQGLPHTEDQYPASPASASPAPSPTHNSFNTFRAQQSHFSRFWSGPQSPDDPANGSRVSSFASKSSKSGSSTISSRDASKRVSPVGMAGNPAVYQSPPGGSPFKDYMIRERVSIHGVCRALEPEGMLPAFQFPAELVGVIGEMPLKRYLETRDLYEKKFARTNETVAARRERPRQFTPEQKTTFWETHFFMGGDVGGRKAAGGREKRGSPAGPAVDAKWAWAMDGSERPPPASIMARSDVKEAWRLSKIADGPVKIAPGGYVDSGVERQGVSPTPIDAFARAPDPAPRVVVVQA